MDFRKLIKDRDKQPMAMVLSTCPAHGQAYQVAAHVTYVEPVDADPYTLWPCPVAGCEYVRVSHHVEELKVVLLQAGAVEVRLSARPDGELDWEYWKKFVNWLDIEP